MLPDSLTFRVVLPDMTTLSGHRAGAGPNLHRENSCVESDGQSVLHLILWPLALHSADTRVWPFVLRRICLLLTQPKSNLRPSSIF